MKKNCILFICLLILVMGSGTAKGQVYNDPLIWTFKTSGPVYSSPLLQNDTLFVGSEDSMFYAIDAIKGTLFWKFKTKSQINTKASISNGTICFGSGNYLYALDLKGNLKWEFKMYDDPGVIQNDLWDYYNSSPTIADTLVFIGTKAGDGGKLYEINLKNGTQVFSWKTSNGTIETTPVVYNGKVYFGDWFGKFYAYNIKTGENVWHYDTIDDAVYANWVNAVLTPPVIYQGNIYFGGRSCFLYCLNAETGKTVWKYHDGGSMWLLGGPTIQDTALYLGSSYQKVLHCFNSNTGKLCWKAELDGLSYSEPFADTTYVFAGTGADPEDNFGSLFAINKKTGVIQDKYSVNGRVQSSPVAYKNAVYFGSSNGNIYALNKQKFVTDIRPKIVFKNSSKVDLGTLLAGTKIDTFVYVSNTGTAKDSVTVSCSKEQVEFSPKYVIIQPKDSAKISVKLNTATMTGPSFSFLVNAISNFSLLYPKVTRPFSLKLTTTAVDNVSESSNMILCPNPLNDYGTLKYTLNRNTNVRISIFDAAGREVLLLENGFKSNGAHTLNFHCGSLAKGIYFCRLTTETSSVNQKIILIK